MKIKHFFLSCFIRSFTKLIIIIILIIIINIMSKTIDKYECKKCNCIVTILRKQQQKKRKYFFSNNEKIQIEQKQQQQQNYNLKNYYSYYYKNNCKIEKCKFEKICKCQQLNDHKFNKNSNKNCNQHCNNNNNNNNNSVNGIDKKFKYSLRGVNDDNENSNCNDDDDGGGNAVGKCTTNAMSIIKEAINTINTTTTITPILNSLLPATIKPQQQQQQQQHENSQNNCTTTSSPSTTTTTTITAARTKRLNNYTNTNNNNNTNYNNNSNNNNNNNNNNAINYYNNKFNKLLITKCLIKLFLIILLITLTMLMPAICQRLTKLSSSSLTTIIKSLLRTIKLNVKTFDLITSSSSSSSSILSSSSTSSAWLSTALLILSSSSSWHRILILMFMLMLPLTAVFFLSKNCKFLRASSIVLWLIMRLVLMKLMMLISRGTALLSAAVLITTTIDVAKSRTTQFLLTMSNGRRGLSTRIIKPSPQSSAKAKQKTRTIRAIRKMIMTILTLTLPCSMLWTLPLPLPSVVNAASVSAADSSSFSSSSNNPASNVGVATPPAATEQQKQQQRQRQLFDLLTKNLLQQKNLEQDHHYQQTQEQQQHQKHEDGDTLHQKQFKRNNNNFNNPPNYYLHDEDDYSDTDGDGDAADDGGSDLNVGRRHHKSSLNMKDSLETVGFVADDGDRRYEKVEKPSTATKRRHNSQEKSIANIPANSISCPRDCLCLNDYFDCTKRHLDRVPVLPNYVHTLDLSNNQLNDTIVLQIRNLPELIKLSLKRNQLTVMPKFIGLQSLRQLNLANNRIQRITNDSLAALPKLKFLNLSKNYLHTLESDFFPRGNRLAHLLLNSNEIANINEDAFKYLGDLIDLELDYNRLSTIPPGTFRFLNDLKKLSLNYNHLEIMWSTFKGLFAMQKLSLKSNNIRALQDGLFHIMRNIETIHLDHNDITSLSRQGLFNLSKLQHLSLSNNSISRIEVDTFEFTQSLVSLDLSSNNISEFKSHHLQCLQRLKILNLGHNKIEYLADNTFDCVKGLEELNLRRNKLALVIEDQNAAPIFKVLKKLKKLDLCGNNLKQISSKSLIGLNNLESLNLAGNHLASIHSNAFEHMRHLQKLIFKSTNFICDCELLWFQRWLNASSQAHIRQMQKNATICGYPDHLLDRDLMQLKPSELICADSPKPVITEEPSDHLAVKGANLTMKCVAISPAAAALAATDELKIKWRHDNQNVREGGSGGGGGGGDHHRGGIRNANTGSSTTPINHSPLYQHNHNSHHHNHHHNHHHHAGIYSYSTTDTQIMHVHSTNQTMITGYLRLYNVSYESSGRYQCIVSNAFGTTYSQKFRISIGIHPTFLQVPSNLTIDSGDTARLVCSATGDPMPEIALKKFGGSDFPAATERRLQVIREENAFVITNAKPIDTGIYTCTAESPAGEIKVNASLIVNDKPQPPIPFTRKEIVVGETSVLECLSEMETEMQQPHREWFKDNKPFHSTLSIVPERFYFEKDKKLLVIMNSTSMDAGLWKCEIMDSSKTYTLQTELVVVKPNWDENTKLIVIVVIIIVLATLIFCLICKCRERKLRVAMLNARVDDRNIKPLMSGRVSALDETQLSTLSRTYLRTPSERPRSLAGLELTNGGIALGNKNASSLEPITIEEDHCLFPITATTLQRYERERNDGGNGGGGPHQSSHHHHHHHHGHGREHHTLEYIRRNSLYDPEQQHLPHHQDHLSSKDSGTGSDAAVKRSIDDFTEALLPPSTTSITLSSTPQKMQSLASTPAKQHELEMAYRRLSTGRASLARIDTFTDDDADLEIEKFNNYNNNPDSDKDPNDTNDEILSPVLGLSEYCDTIEMSELNTKTKENRNNDANIDADVDVDVDVDDPDGVYCRLLKNNNNNKTETTTTTTLPNDKFINSNSNNSSSSSSSNAKSNQQLPRENLSLNLHLNSNRFSDHRRRPLYEPSDEDSPISAGSLRNNSLSTTPTATATAIATTTTSASDSLSPATESKPTTTVDV